MILKPWYLDRLVENDPETMVPGHILIKNDPETTVLGQID